MELSLIIESIIDDLKNKLPSVLMYSGGVESSFLLKIMMENNLDFVVVTVDNGLIPEYQMDFIQKTTSQFGIQLNIFSFDFQHIYAIKNNFPGRCYFCKRNMFLLVKEKFKDHTVVEGSSCQENGARPGEMALTEMNIFSPLKVYCIERKAIINFLRQTGFPFIKNNTCLATRFPYFCTITKDMVNEINKKESKLFKVIKDSLRLRYNCDGRFILEMERENLLKISDLPDEELKEITFKIRKF